MGILSSQVASTVAAERARKLEQEQRAKAEQRAALQQQEAMARAKQEAVAAENQRVAEANQGRGLTNVIRETGETLSAAGGRVAEAWNPTKQTDPNAGGLPITEGQVMAPNQLATNYANQPAAALGTPRPNRPRVTDPRTKTPRDAANAADSAEEQILGKAVAQNPTAKQNALVLQTHENNDNETDSMPAKAAHDAALAMIRKRNRQNVSSSSLAKQYEEEIKNNPWYEDNKVWGAALGFGLALAAGGSGSEALLFGAMVGDDVRGREADELNRLRVGDETSRQEYNKREQELENSEISRLATLADKEAADMEARRAAKLKAKATEATARGTLNKEIQKANIRMAEGKSEQYDAIHDQWEALDNKVYEFGVRTGIESKVDDEGHIQFARTIDPALVGSLDQLTGKVGEWFGAEEGSSQTQIKQAIEDWALVKQKEQKGVATDKDYQVIKNSLPGVGSSSESWNKWIGRFNKVHKDLQRDLERKAKRALTAGTQRADYAGLQEGFITPHERPGAYRRTQGSTGAPSIKEQEADAIVNEILGDE